MGTANSGALMMKTTVITIQVMIGVATAALHPVRWGCIALDALRNRCERGVAVSPGRAPQYQKSVGGRSAASHLICRAPARDVGKAKSSQSCGAGGGRIRVQPARGSVRARPPGVKQDADVGAGHGAVVVQVRDARS